MRYKATTKVVSVTDADSGMTYPVVIGARVRQLSQQSRRRLWAAFSLLRAGSDQVVRYDPGHPTPAPPTGGLDNVASALKLGTFSEAVEVINIRAAMVGVLGVVLEELGSGRSFWAQLFSGSLFSAIAVMGFVTVASVAPFVAGVVDGDELFPREDNPFTDERLPEFWTPTAEKVNGRLAAAGLGLLMVQELMKGGAQL